MLNPRRSTKTLVLSLYLAMLGLRKFIGSREGESDHPRTASQGSSHMEGKKERLQAKVQELGYTGLEGNDLLSNPTFEPVNVSNPRRKIIADQHRVKVPINLLNRNNTDSKSLKSIGQSYDSSSRPPRATQSLSEKKEEASHDFFDTDVESLEATATFSDFTDPRDARIDFQGFERSGNRFDQVHGDTYDNPHTPLPILETQQRGESHISDQDDPDDLIEGQDESEYEESRDDDSAGDKPERDGKDDDGMVENLIISESTQQPSYTVGFRSGPRGFPSSVEKDVESALELPPIFPENWQESALKHGNELLRTSVTPLVSRTLVRDALNEEHDQNRHNGQRRLQEVPLKKIQVRPNETTQYDASRNTLLPEAGTSKNISLNNSQVRGQDPQKQSGPTSSEFPRAMVSTTLQRPSEPGKLLFIGDSRNSLAEDGQDLRTSNAYKRATDLDYTYSQLASMTYEQLSSEAFDDDPHSPGKHIREDLTDSPLAGKLQYIYNLKRDDKQHLQRREVFSSMTIAQHEECGDLLIEKFSAILTRYKEARQQKRKLAVEFEDEVARREERVRGKKGAVERDLRRLRRAGEDVVKGRDD